MDLMVAMTIEQRMMEQFAPWMFAVIFAAAILASWFIGQWWARRWPMPPGDEVEGKFTEASMALLGLLLAFTFSMSLARHDERRQAAVAHSNALGDLYTCATLLKEPERSRLQNLLREYALYKRDIARGDLYKGRDSDQAIAQTLD